MGAAKLHSAAAETPADAGETDPEERRAYPIRWTDHVDLKDLDGLDAALDRSVDLTEHGGDEDGLVLTAPDETNQVRVKTGREYVELVKAGYFARTHYDRAMEHWFKRAFGPILYLKRAKASRMSYVRELRLDENPLEELPPTLAIGMSGDEVKLRYDGLREGKSLGQVYPKLYVEKATPTRVDFEGDGGINITLVAWADFNADDIEDVLLFRAYHVYGGTLGGSHHVVLTRLKEGSRWRELPWMNIYEWPDP